MADQINTVSLIRYQPIERFFKRGNDDFERIPLLAIGCICLLASKIQSLGDFSWGHVVDFGKLGGKISSLTDYWELVDFAKGARTAVAAAWPVFTKLDLTTEEGRGKGLEAAKTVALFSLKAFSNLVNFIEMMVEVSALKGLNIHMWKMYGAGSGALAFTKLLYDQLSEGQKDPEDITEVKDVAQEMYRAQHAWKTFYSNTITASILAIKIIGFCGAFHALHGASSVMKFIAERKGDLLLASFTTLMAGILGSHLYGEQMTEFKKLNKTT